MRLPSCRPTPANETTVYAHLNGGGMGAKVNDIFGFYACHSCHSAYDGARSHDYDRDWLDHQALIAMKRTQEILLEKGLM